MLTFTDEDTQVINCYSQEGIVTDINQVLKMFKHGANSYNHGTFNRT